MTKTQKYLAKGPGWTIDLVIEQNINVSKHKPGSSSSYIKLSKNLTHSKKSLINIQITGNNVCLKWCLGRYLHPVDKNPAIIGKTDKDFPR